MVGFPRGVCLYICDRALLELLVFAATWIIGTPPYTRNGAFRYWIG